jgi:hypothetical protein
MSVRKVRLEVRGPDRTLAEEPAALIAHGGVCEGGGPPASAGRSSSTRTPARLVLPSAADLLIYMGKFADMVGRVGIEPTTN